MKMKKTLIIAFLTLFFVSVLASASTAGFFSDIFDINGKNSTAGYLFWRPTADGGTEFGVIPSKIGAEAGAAAGAVVGGVVGGPPGAAIGAAIGGIAGWFLGP